MSRLSPADVGAKMVATTPIEQPPPEPREWHTFEKRDYLVITSHRGVLIQRNGSYTDAGRAMAEQDASVVAVNYRIGEGATDLTVWVIERVCQYERLYAGEGPHPHYFEGSSYPKTCALYEGYDRNRRVISLRPVHCSNRFIDLDRPLPASLADHHFLTGD